MDRFIAESIDEDLAQHDAELHTVTRAQLAAIHRLERLARRYARLLPWDERRALIRAADDVGQA